MAGLPALPPHPWVPTKDSRQTNSPFAPLLFLWVRSPRAAHWFTNPFVVQKKSSSVPGVQHTSDYTLRDTLVFTSGLYKPGCSQVSHKYIFQSQWSRSVPARITFYPAGADSSTIVELALLVSSLPCGFCQVSLWPVNSALTE